MGHTLLHAPRAAGARAGRKSPLPRTWQAASKTPEFPRKTNSPQISVSVPRFLLLPQEARGR